MEKNIINKIDPPTIITLDVTYHCTLRCLHCFNSSGEHITNQKELSDDEILNLCDEITKLKPTTVCLCGGEPLLRKDLLYKVIQKIRTETHHHTQVNMVTNGELLTQDVADKLKAAGIGLVQVSLDGSCAETHDWLRGKKGAFDSALRAIKCLKDTKILTAVSCTPTKRNINEYEKALELCDSLGVYSFRVQPLMSLGRASKNLNNEMLNYYEYMKIQKILNKYKYKSNMITEWGDPIEHITTGSMESTGGNISLSIDAYGNIEISPYFPIRIGNVRKHKISEYWNSGLNTVWTIPFVKELCKLIISESKMELNDYSDKFPRNYMEDPIFIDLIDTKDINKLSLNNILKLG